MPRNCTWLAGAAALALAAGSAVAQPAGDRPSGDRPAESGPRPDRPEAPQQQQRSEQQHAEQARKEAPPRDQAPREQGRREEGNREQSSRDQPGRTSPEQRASAEAQNRETARREQRQQVQARREQPGQSHPEQVKKNNERQPDGARPETPRSGQPARREDIREIGYKDAHGREFRVPTNDRVRVVTRKDDMGWAAADRQPHFNGCPPGLDRKFAGCKLPAETHPPSHAWHDPGWFSRGYDDETRYRYADGYMLRIGTGNSVASYVPLLGGALAVGRNWPGTYKPVALPGYYTSYYGLGSEGSYRYYDNTIYRVKPENAAITGIAALLVGSRVQVGQAMPAGYDVYNVPYGYRDQYSDGTDALYRYSDGYIYQLDPATRLVRAAIELLA
ncbi:hypothetical protein [Novosphingobium lindaniclasticum]